MARVENLEKLVATLRARAKEAERDPRVTVGYTANYALPVHENLERVYANGQAKFLEQPARELADELGEMVRRAVRAGVTLGRALLLAGLRLQRESQLLCPVRTGHLRGSAFTRLDD